MAWRTLASTALVLCSAGLVRGEGYLSYPSARNVLYDGGSEGLEAIGKQNAGGAEMESREGHGLCGDFAWRREFTSPHEFGGGPPLVIYEEGSTIEINVTLTVHRMGFFEFRLCELPDGGRNLSAPITQDCLNEHVLHFDAAYTEASYSGQMEAGRSSPADYVGTPRDLLATSLATQCGSLLASGAGAPEGSCCNGGGTCSVAALNSNRWVVPLPEAGPEYTMRFILPSGVTCERCVLQWFYQTGDGVDMTDAGYPEAFWNCADIAIVPEIEAVNETAWASFLTDMIFDDEDEQCWSAVPDEDHALCRFYKCPEVLLAEGLCSLDDPYDSSDDGSDGDDKDDKDDGDDKDDADDKDEKDDGGDEAGSEPGSEDNGTVSPGASTSKDSALSTVIPVAAGAGAGLLVLLGGGFVFARRRGSRDRVLEALPVADPSGGGGRGGRGSNSATSRGSGRGSGSGGSTGASRIPGRGVFRNLFSSSSAATGNEQQVVMYAKEVETVVIASPIADAMPEL